MTRSSLLILSLLLAGCSKPATEPTADADSNVAEAPAQQDEVPSLDGQWTVTQIQNAPPVQAYTMEAKVGDGTLTITSDCVRKVWDLTQTRNVVAFTKGRNAGCGREATPGEEMAAKVIDSATIAMFSNEGKDVQLSGAGGSLAMVRR